MFFVKKQYFTSLRVKKWVNSWPRINFLWKNSLGVKKSVNSWLRINFLWKNSLGVKKWVNSWPRINVLTKNIKKQFGSKFLSKLMIAYEKTCFLITMCGFVCFIYKKHQKTLKNSLGVKKWVNLWTRIKKHVFSYFHNVFWHKTLKTL